MNYLLKKILDLSLKSGFLKASAGNTSLEHINFGPMSLLLANNIRNEWLHSNVIGTTFNVFLYETHPKKHWTEDCQSSYRYSLKLLNDQLPFGLASIVTRSTSTSEQENPVIPATTVYRRLIFINENESQQYFYRLQHQRKIWWRKFSTNPERFDIVEGKNEEIDKCVKITANFPWTTEVVEIIQNHGSSPLTTHSSMFEVKAGRKKWLPHVIESVCMEHAAVRTYLFDSFHQMSSLTLPRLHCHLTPYSSALSVHASDKKFEELKQLAAFIIFSLRKAGMHTLLTSGGLAEKAPDPQFLTYDSLGIPYTVVLTDDALTTGIVGLRNRDTTLMEQVHVSKLTSYVKELLKKN